MKVVTEKHRKRLERREASGVGEVAVLGEMEKANEEGKEGRGERTRPD